MKNIKYFLGLHIFLFLVFTTACSQSITVDESIHTRLDEANRAIQSGNAELAISILQSLQSEGYLTVNVWVALANAYQSNEQPLMAISITHQLLQRLPRDVGIKTLFNESYEKIEGKKLESIWTFYGLSQQIAFISPSEHLSILIVSSVAVLASLFLKRLKRISSIVLIAILALQFIVLLTYTLQLYIDSFHPIAIYTDSDLLPVYSTKSENAFQLFEMPQATLFYIDRVEGEWLKVVTYYGRHGWIMTKQFELLRHFDMYSQ